MNSSTGMMRSLKLVKNPPSKSVFKSKSFWIGILQMAGGLATGFLTGNWTAGIPQVMLGGTAIIDRIFGTRVPVHVTKEKVSN